MLAIFMSKQSPPLNPQGLLASAGSLSSPTTEGGCWSTSGGPAFRRLKRCRIASMKESSGIVYGGWWEKTRNKKQQRRQVIRGSMAVNI